MNGQQVEKFGKRRVKSCRDREPDSPASLDADKLSGSGEIMNYENRCVVLQIIPTIPSEPVPACAAESAGKL